MVQQKAFDDVKDRLINAPVLACPDWSKTFTPQTDASTEGLDAVLTQEDEEGEHVIACASRTLNKGYLEGYRFIVITDH